MITEALDFRFLLIENYKKLKLNEEQLATIFVIDHLISQGNPFVNADLLSLKMTLDLKTIDKILSFLLEKGYINYVTKGKKTITTLEPLKKLLFREFQLTLNKEEEMEHSENIDNSIHNIYKTFEELLSRPLSPAEFSKIREWVSFGYTDDMIINALKEAVSKGKKNFSTIDKILLNMMAREDKESEGHTPINETWDRNLEETIRIAKTPWVKKK